VTEIEIIGEADAVVGKSQCDLPIFGVSQHNLNLAGLPIGEGVFEGIGNQFIQDRTGLSRGSDRSLLEIRAWQFAEPERGNGVQ
jgi:hypothetical protein